jgi:hypothetical protein
VARIVIAAVVTAPVWGLVAWPLAAAAFAAAFLAVASGHGSGIDMGHSPLDDPDELRRDLWAPRDTAAHDTCFLAVSGLLVTLPAGTALLSPVAVGAVHPAWLLIGLAGAVKAGAYRGAWMLSRADGRLRWPLLRPRALDSATDLAEVVDKAATCALVQALWWAG